MRCATTLAVLVLALHPAAVADGVPQGNPVEAALRKPPATGLLVTFVADGGQAQAKGVKPGDVLVAYGGAATPTRKALEAAKQAAASAKRPVPLALRRGAKRVDVEVAPGPLGIEVAAVEEGKPAKPLPPPTLKSLDLGKLDQARGWYRFTLDGKTQVGFEQSFLYRAGSGFVLALRHEVGFDGGKRWGVNHQQVHVQMLQREGRLHALSTEYVNVRNGWTGKGKRVEPEGGAPYWEVTWPGADGKPVVKKVALPADLPILPTYLVTILVERMPRKKGACLHYRPLHEGMGTVGLASALYVVGQEEIEHDGAKTAAWRIELRALGGGTKTTWWVDGAGKALRIDYGGAQAHRSTAQKVVAGIPEGIEPGRNPPGR